MIRFPLIYNGLDIIFPKNLSTILQQEQFAQYREQLCDSDNVIVVMKQGASKHILGYYVNGRLFLASHTSIGGYTPK